MEIQQHDGMVVEVAGSRQGFAKRKRGGRGVTGGRGRRQGLGCGCPSSPPLYIGARGACPPWRSHLEGGGGVPRGGGPPGATTPLGFPTRGAHAPSGGNGPLGFPARGAHAPSWGNSPLGFPNPRRLGPLGGAHQPIRGWFPRHFRPWGPLG